ncbi:MAG: FAD-binding oxidoreductase [Myxococcales bacterium]|nr:FAD-binding oxidoreductase [Myxococcales bacterium]
MSLDAALDQWASLLVAANVIRSGPSLDDLNRTTQSRSAGGSAPLMAALRPSSREQLPELLAIARQHQVRLHQSSAGKSWGLGTRQAPEPAVLLDLSGLCRISDFDSQLGAIDVEPGVTFQQLYEYLKAQRSRFFLNVTGSSPHSSVLANALERGDGAGPYADRFAHICNLEVMLSSGEVLRTGFGSFLEDTNPGLQRVARWGVGPALDGLFSQSGFGLVTRLTLWLCPLPRSLHLATFGLKDPGRLGRLWDALGELKLDGTLNASIGLWNDYRVVSSVARFPAGADPAQALPRQTLEAMPEWPGMRWSGTTAVYAASRDQGNAARIHMERCLRPLVDDLAFFEASGDASVGRELLHPGHPAFKFLQGIPHEHSLQSAYWRMPPERPQSSPLDLAQDGCGVNWVCAALPFRGRDLVRAVSLSERILTEHGFEPLFACVATAPRSVNWVPLMVYDRDVPGADDRASACHDALYAALSAAGYLPYRLGTQSLASLPNSADQRSAVLERLRVALDPAGVFARRFA